MLQYEIFVGGEKGVLYRLCGLAYGLRTVLLHFLNLLELELELLTTATTDKGLAKRGLRKVRVKRAAWADFGGGQWAKVYAAKWNRATGEDAEGPVEIEW